MKSSIILNEAKDAYRKFSKSTKNIFGFSKSENLEPFHEAQKKENAYNSVNLGIKEIPLENIIGSVQKYTDFDKNFAPKNRIIEERWVQIYIANMYDEPLPPVILYKLKDNYYVYDGNHRISVAKFLGFNSIEAEIIEYLPSGDNSEDVIYREKNLFEKETGLSQILFSDPGKYEKIIQEIKKFEDFLLKKKNMTITFREAAFRWYKDIFLQITKIIEENEIEENFSSNNLNDLFLFILDHKYYLSRERNQDVGYLFAVIDFINMVKTNEKLDLDYKCKLSPQTIEVYKRLKKLDKEIILSVDKVVKNEVLLEVTGIDFDFSDFTLEQVEKYRLDHDIKNFKEAAKLWYETDYIHLLNYFITKVKKLPNKYADYLEYFVYDDRRVFYSIHKYRKLHYYYIDNEELDLLSWKSSVLNYIIEIYISIIDGVINDRIPPKEIVNFYYKLEEEYFYLLKNERRLILENKSANYNKIKELDLSTTLGWFGKKLKDMDIAEILIEAKNEEFLKNFKNPKPFEKILLEYGEIKKYETYTKFEEMLDIIGEETFIQKVKNELLEISKVNTIVRRYKTLSILEAMKGNNRDLGFVDFYVNVIKHGLKYTDSFDLVNILDITFDYLATNKVDQDIVLVDEEDGEN